MRDETRPQGPGSEKITATRSDASLGTADNPAAELVGVAGWKLWRTREQFIAELDEHLAELDAVRVVDLDDYRRRKHAVESGSMWVSS